MTERRVHIGTFSETPRKVFTYNQTDPASYVVAATPSRKDSAQPLKSSMNWRSSSSELDDEGGEGEGEGDSSTSSRPKTSRGTSHPSPDAFFDYVIPSPLSKHGSDFDLGARSFMSLEKERKGAAGKREKDPKAKMGKRTKDSEAEDQLRRAELMERQDETIFIGCWLFGSLLRV